MALPDIRPDSDPEQLYADLMAYVAQANALLDARDTVNLAGLDTAVDALCKRIGALDKPEAGKFAPRLDQLLADIGALEKKMVTLRDEVATAINSIGTNKKASSAYRNAPTGQVEE